MRIPQHTIDKILDRIDLVDLIGARVKLKKSGKSYTGCCPFHQEKTPSFHVYREKSYYHCFGCKANGNAIRYIMETENRSFMDVLEDLAKRAGVDLPKQDEFINKNTYKKVVKPTQSVTATSTPMLDKSNTLQSTATEQKPSDKTFSFTLLDTQAPTPTWSEDMLFMDAPPPDFDDPYLTHDLHELNNIAPPSYDPISESLTENKEGNLYDLLEEIAKFYQSCLISQHTAQHYLAGRGLTAQTIEFWRLGYAPESTLHLAERFPEDIEGLKLLGLLRTGDNGKNYCLLRDRVIFPIRNTRGKIVGFGGRALNNDIKPKYINSTESEVFRKGEILFGLYEGIKARANTWMMVEGYLDVISLYQAGVHGAVASMGTATNIDHLELLFKQANSVTLAFDGDTAGQKAAWRTFEMALPILNDGRELRFLVLPTDQDPDSLIRHEGTTAFKRRVSNSPPLSDFLYTTLATQYDLSKPEAKASLLAEVKTYTAQLPQYGTYRRLLEQSIREKLGLGWRNKQAPVSDQMLEFTQSSLEEKMLMLLLQYPSLVFHLQELKPLMPSTHLLYKALVLIEQCQAQLPDDSESSLFFLLGAWKDATERQKICQLLETNDIANYIQRPERLDGLCQELVLKITENAIVRNMSTLPLRDTQRSNLNIQLQNIRQQLGFRVKNESGSIDEI